MMENTSGQGQVAVIPAEIQVWNWGAFLLSWIWGLSHRVWISLLCFIPFVSIVMVFVLGAKGNKWAWQNQKWDNVDHFKKTQGHWAWAGLILALITLVLYIIAFVVAGS